MKCLSIPSLVGDVLVPKRLRTVLKKGALMLVRTKTVTVLLVVLFASTLQSTANDERNKSQVAGTNPAVSDSRAPMDEPTYQGKKLNYWIKAIQNRNEELMPLAFDAIRALGPDARATVPQLIRVVAAPFTPIQLGIDSDELIANKLYDMEVRSEAIDTLASVGEAAAPATIPLVNWALTVRVMPS